MPNKHKHKKAGWHLPGPVVARLRAYVDRTGQTATAVVAEAIERELDRREHAERTEGTTP